MSKPLFDKAETEVLVERLRALLADELDMELGGLEADALFALIARDIGSAFYNRGLHDARAAISARMDEVSEVVYALERVSPVDRDR
ncbi:DUF2164 domain-containing protein [Stappia sp. ES.058]|uniref:DUF2164 domain-containing protein n=1 Tax=Stappia sp. ES.058 TaxID=1881061 RepID=UPI00087BE74E|nr:DUF2164 domain-containing protein [Stappia sp. ES.058]SDU23082.1 Uncharacterized conserved protein, DUF2164 family [Stappia sp. ES.058]